MDFVQLSNHQFSEISKQALLEDFPQFVKHFYQLIENDIIIYNDENEVYSFNLYTDVIETDITTGISTLIKNYNKDNFQTVFSVEDYYVKIVLNENIYKNIIKILK